MLSDGSMGGEERESGFNREKAEVPFRRAAGGEGEIIITEEGGA